MTFSGKICLMIILKIRKDQGSAFSLEDTFLTFFQIHLTHPKLFRAKEWHLSCFEKHEKDIVWNRDSIKLWRQNLAPDARQTKEHFTLASF